MANPLARPRWRALALATVLLGGFLLITPSPTLARVPGDGRPIILMYCDTFRLAEFQATLYVGSMQVPAITGCIVISPFYPTDIEDQQIVMGPVQDADGDTFAVYEILLDDGRTIYPFAWWAPKFSPIGYEV